MANLAADKGNVDFELSIFQLFCDNNESLERVVSRFYEAVSTSGERCMLNIRMSTLEL